ncbi:MAG: 16S rRNA processing protein RimM [Gammaproteobacteria bacterium]|jgi:16S rRNA processing protein RimM
MLPVRKERDEAVCVGHILGAQGIKGEVRVFSNTDPRGNIVGYTPWQLEIDGQLKNVDISGRLQGKNVIANIFGIDDRDKATALTGCKIYISSEQLPPLENDEYYWSDLIGLEVKSMQAEALGTIDSMMETGASDVMIVKGDRERLIPFVMKDIVQEIDLEKKLMIVDWQADY